MPKSVETTDVKKASTKETQELVYVFPTIGDGVSIKASSQDEANKKAAKLLEEINARGESSDTSAE